LACWRETQKGVKSPPTGTAAPPTTSWIGETVPTIAQRAVTRTGRIAARGIRQQPQRQARVRDDVATTGSADQAVNAVADIGAGRDEGDVHNWPASSRPRPMLRGLRWPGTDCGCDESKRNSRNPSRKRFGGIRSPSLVDITARGSTRRTAPTRLRAGVRPEDGFLRRTIIAVVHAHQR